MNLVDLIPCSTETEATCVGIFLTEMHAMVERWRRDRDAYESECAASETFNTLQKVGGGRLRGEGGEEGRVAV